VKNDHVVAIHSVQDDAQPPYLVMEMIDGISLQDKIDKAGPLGLKEILRIGMQMAEGLTAAHKQGLVHRDIKPANILLENGVERVKITDFGLARAVDDASVTQSGTVAGTPMYMSPEQAEGLPIDHRSDLFSLGTVLYAMCTGHPPFRASGTHAVLKRVIDASPRPIREINNEVPEWLCEIIAKLHAKRPEDRFQTAKDVGELLGQRLADVQAGRTIEQPSARRGSPDPAADLDRRSPASAEGTGDLRSGVPAGSGDPRRLQPEQPVGLRHLLAGFVAWIVFFAIFCVLFGALIWPLSDWPVVTQLRTSAGIAVGVSVALWAMSALAMRWNRKRLAAALSTAGGFSGILAFALGIGGFREWVREPPAALLDRETALQRNALRGKWLLLSGEANGEPLPKEFLSAVRIAFDDAFELRIADFFESRNLIVLDGAASPKTITSIPGVSNSIWRGDAEKVQVTASSLLQRYYLHSGFRGIYELEGNQLKLCIAQGGYSPPKRFDSRTDDGAQFGALNLVLVRAPDERLQGKWDLVEAELQGAKLNVTGWMEFTGATGRSSLAGVVSEWDFKLNTSAQPKHIDFTSADGTPHPPSIYDLQGDTLMIAEGTTRPDSFKSQGRRVYRYVRVREPDWLQLFNGKDTSAWDMKGSPLWKFENGILSCKGGELRPVRTQFNDCRIKVEARYFGGEAYLRLGPQAIQDPKGKMRSAHQLIHLHNDLNGGKTGSITMHDGSIKSVATNLDDCTRPGEWFTLEVLYEGRHIKTWVNGKPAADFTNQEPGTYVLGAGMSIGAVGNGGELEIRKVEVRDLPTEQPGWVQLFNGKDLSGWVEFHETKATKPKSPWEVGGEILLCKGSPEGYLRTKAAYENYVLRLEWRYPRGTLSDNMGAMLFHAAEPDQLRPNAIELLFHDLGKKGSIHGLRGATFAGTLSQPKTKPAGEWNRLVVTSRDGSVQVSVNGRDLGTVTDCQPRRGFIALRSSGREIHFRKIEIKELRSLN
jgi:uncharacterized protein (TIGR03067 family)